MGVVRPWIEKSLMGLMGGVEDDILVEYVCTQLTWDQDGATGGDVSTASKQKLSTSFKTTTDDCLVTPETFQLNITPFLGTS